MSTKIRVDKWLWAIRFYKKRSQARSACQSGKIKINNKRIKPSKTLQIGDLITIQKGFVKYKYEVKGIIEKRVSSTYAKENYLDLTPKEELIKQKFNTFSIQNKRKKGQGRPTKKERRTLDKLSEKF